MIPNYLRYTSYLGNDGSVSRIYTGIDEDPDIVPIVKDGYWNLRQLIPSADLYLAIGKTEQINSFIPASRWDNGKTSSIRITTCDERQRFSKWNLLDIQYSGENL